MQADQRLIEMILARDEDAFETLFARYEAMIRRHVGRTVRSPGATEDVVQEVFLRVWMHADQWQGRGSVKGWLFSIATNLALNVLRTRRRRPQVPLEGSPDSDDELEERTHPAWLTDSTAIDFDVALEKAEAHEHLWQLVDNLPPEKRQVFLLVHQDELPIREVADRLGIPEGTVKSRLYYGLKKLAREWQGTEWEAY